MIPYVAGLGAGALIGLVSYQAFRSIDPASINGYAGCRGWCEGTLNACGGPHPKQVPEQPINTYTNLIYAAAGVFSAFYFATWSAQVFMLTMVVLCVASSLYHALSTFWSGRFDVGSIYAVFAGVAFYAICTALGVAEAPTAILMLVAAAAFGFAGFRFKGWYRENVNWKIGILLIVAYLVLAERIVTHERQDAVWETLASGAFFMLATATWWLDRRCEFPIRRWGHGVWHLLTGVAIAVLYRAIEAAR